LGLLPALRSLAPVGVKDSTSESILDGSSSSRQSNDAVSRRIARPLPDPLILAHLLAHICNNNYTILSIFAKPSDYDPSELNTKLADISVTRGEALPLLWEYLWGFENTSLGILGGKGKARASLAERQIKTCEYGHYEKPSPLVELTFRMLLIAAQTSTSNLIAIHNSLPRLCEFLLVRLYGPPEKRTYENTFPARDDWTYTDEKVDDDDLEWKAPGDALRWVYLALLRRLLEAGVNQQIAWRLFTLVKIRPTPPSALVSTANSRSQSPTPPVDDLNVTPKSHRKQRPQLHIKTPAATASELDMERLQPEVLDVIRHAMKTRRPDAFVFKGGKGESEGGIEMRDMGRVWQAGQKGFNFSVSPLQLSGRTYRLTTSVLGVYNESKLPHHAASFLTARCAASALPDSHPR
jgi:hypothetical protein